VANDGIKIFVPRRIGTTAFIRLANPTRAVDEGFVKPARVRLIRFLIAEMPFAKNAAGVTGLLQHLRQNGRLERHALALEDGMRHAVFHRMPAGHDGTPRRRASRAHQKPREPRARVVQLVEVWSTNPWMPMPPNRPVTLIIGDDENDVRLLRLGFIETTEDADEHRENSQSGLHGPLINQIGPLANPRLEN